MVLDVHGVVSGLTPRRVSRSLKIAEAVANSPHQTDELRAQASRRVQACERMTLYRTLEATNVHDDDIGAGSSICMDWGSRPITVDRVDIPS